MPASTGTWQLQTNRPTFICVQSEKTLQQLGRMPSSVVLFSDTQDTSLTYVRLVPTKIKLFDLGLAEYISTTSSLGSGEDSLTLTRNSTGEMSVIKDRCVGAQGF